VVASVDFVMDGPNKGKTYRFHVPFLFDREDGEICDAVLDQDRSVQIRLRGPEGTVFWVVEKLGADGQRIGGIEVVHTDADAEVVIVPSRPCDAVWRSVSPMCSCCGKLDLSFEVTVPGRAKPLVLRLAIPAESARYLLDSLDEYLSEPPRKIAPVCHPCRDHSDKSSGNPMAEVSIPSPAENVALLIKSSNAEVGE
jgi:hypothetical protein